MEGVRQWKVPSRTAMESNFVEILYIIIKLGPLILTVYKLMKNLIVYA